MNPSSFTPEQMEKLLTLAAGRLGTPAEQLKETLEKEGVQGVSASLPPEWQALLSDREQLTALLADPSIRKMLTNLLG